MVIEINNIKLTPEKALIIHNTAIIADLHLGLENAMLEKGISVPRMQIIEIVGSIKRFIEKYGVERIVIAGDLKHEFSKNLPYEWEDIEHFLKEIKDVEIEVVRGNHDNFLATILAKHGIELRDEIDVHGWTVVHGHKGCDRPRIIMGHEHPAVKVKFRGSTYTYHCYLRIKKPMQEIVVLPAFSPLASGSDLLAMDRFLSPILSDVGDDEIEIYAVEDDVVYLGKLKDLKRLLCSI
jgi:putative SbcD/Mre11-related phosphoesterase